MKREHKRVESMHFTGEKMGGREGRESPDAAVLYGRS